MPKGLRVRVPLCASLETQTNCLGFLILNKGNILLQDPSRLAAILFGNDVRSGCHRHAAIRSPCDIFISRRS